MTRRRPGPRARAGAALAALLIAVAAAGCGGSGGGDAQTPTTPRELAAGGYRAVWGSGYDSSSDGAGFTSSEGTSHGECTRAVRDGAAVYTWAASASDGASTRCYPDQLFAHESGGEWVDPVKGPWVFSGRFRVDMRDPAQLRDDFMSLITFQAAPPVDEAGHQNSWNAVVTINLDWSNDSTRPWLNIFHVPGFDQGSYDRPDARPFPLGRWVTIKVEWDVGNHIRVYQDGELILRASKETGLDAGGGPLPVPDAELYGLHLGGYAGAGVTGWTIRNDDVVVAAKP